MIKSKGFTLLELIIVIIIIGILAALALSSYSGMVEKGRTAEAKLLLGDIRTMETAYFLENGVYTTNITGLGLGITTDTCNNASWYKYTSSSSTAAVPVLTATRCTSGGKSPTGSTPPGAYTIQLDMNTSQFNVSGL